MRKRPSSQDGWLSAWAITTVQSIYTSIQSLVQAVAQVLYYHWLEGKFKGEREKIPLSNRENIVI